MSWACYFARPLDAQLHVGRDLTINPAAQMLGEIRWCLDNAGAQVYDPGTALLVEPDGNPFAQQVHNGALEACDGVLGWLPDGVPTIGVPIEIAKARQLFKPCVVVGGEHAAKSTVLASLEIPVFGKPGEAVEALQSMLPVKDENGEPVEMGEPIGQESIADSFNEPVYAFGYPEPVAYISPSGDQFPTALRAELARFWVEMRNEIERATIKHPRSNDREWTTPERWLSIWTEEVFEVIQAWNDRQTPLEVQDELVQASAMGFRLWEALRFAHPREGQA